MSTCDRRIVGAGGHLGVSELRLREDEYAVTVHIIFIYLLKIVNRKLNIKCVKTQSRTARLKWAMKTENIKTLTLFVLQYNALDMHLLTVHRVTVKS